MPGYGFGFGNRSPSRCARLPRLPLLPDVPESPEVDNRMTVKIDRTAPISMTFAEPVELGTWPDGEQYIIGRATLVAETPASSIASGAYVDEETGSLLSPAKNYSDKVTHGLQVNPGNRVHAPGGLTVNNKGNQPTGYGTMVPISGTTGVAVDAARNQAPTYTGAPLEVGPGDTIVKMASLLPAKNSMRPGGIGKMYLDVLAEHPAPGTLRFGTASVDNAHSINESEWDLSVFKNIPRVPEVPSFETLCGYLDKDFGAEFTDFVNRQNAIAHDLSYSWDIGTEMTYVLTSLHFDFAPAQKRMLLNKLWARVVIDYVERAREGGVCQVPYGGQDSWTKFAVAMCAAALHGTNDQVKLQQIKDILDVRNGLVSSVDMMHPVGGLTPEMIVNPLTNSTLERPADELKWWMMEAVDYVQNPLQGNSGAASNWDSEYRSNVDMAGMSNAIACYLTTGAWNLFGRTDAFASYFKTFRQQAARSGRYNTGIGRNFVTPDRATIIEVLWANGFASDAAPIPLKAYARANLGEGTSTAWVRFDHTLDELTNITASNYVVRVNDSVVAGVTIAPPPTPSPRDTSPNGTIGNYEVPPEGWVPYGIFRTNIGLILPLEIAPSDTVSIEYKASGSVKLRSCIDNVPVAAFPALAAENVTPTVTGTNTAFPIVHFDGDAHVGYKDKIGIGADSSKGTLFIKGLRWQNTPSGTDLTYVFAAEGIAGALEISVNSKNQVRVTLRDNGIKDRIQTPALTPGTSYDLIITWDQTDLTMATGVTLYINGAVKTPTPVSFWKGQGSITTYSVGADYRFAKNSSEGVVMDMELAAFWFMPGVRVPVSDFGKFAADQIGTLGDGVTGTRPPLFFTGDSGQWNSRFGINRGSGLPMFRQTDALVGHVNGGAWSPLG